MTPAEIVAAIKSLSYDDRRASLDLIDATWCIKCGDEDGGRRNCWCDYETGEYDSV
jgi:hypothetical protein